MLKKKTVLMVSLLMLVVFAAPALASTINDFTVGKPTQLVPGRDMGFYIWRDGGVWHLATTTQGHPRKFSGVIRTDGDIHAVQQNSAEWGKDRIKADYRRDTISFNFRTGRSVDGLSFRVTNQSYIDFDLYIDGQRISPIHIHVGHDNWHPAQAFFRLKFHHAHKTPPPATITPKPHTWEYYAP